MPRILKTFANFWSSQPLLLLLASAQAAQGATEHAPVLWLLLSCGAPVHFNNVRMMEILWHMCVPAACIWPGTEQNWESQCGHFNNANMATAMSPVFLQMCDIVSWVWVKNGSIPHSSQTTLWFSILDSAIVECKYYTDVLGQLRANMNKDVMSKTACNQLAQNTPNTASR